MLRDLACVLLLIAACGTHPQLAPTNATITAGGTLVSTTSIPPEAPRGEVRIESRGTARLKTAKGRTLQALHLRITVANDRDDDAWTIDTREQWIDLGAWRSRPTHAITEHESALVDIGPRDRRTVDLFYALPHGLAARDVAGFVLRWKVSTPARTIVSRTPFGRAPTPFLGPAYAGWGPPYWWTTPSELAPPQRRAVVIRADHPHAVLSRLGGTIVR